MMNQTTKPEVWPVDKPFVVFMVPTARMHEYARLMNRLFERALQDLRWTPYDIELIGLVSDSPQHTIEGIIFMEESGIDTRKVSLLMLWGETAMGVNFEHLVPEECGIGRVILPATGVVLPTVRMPSIESGWWADSLHQEYAVSVFANLVRDGRPELEGTEPFSIASLPGVWN